jgi:hypothetical protein
MHCFVHQNSRREACTFWSGCGAIRREVFLRHSGFSMHYRRPAIEDIELGYRLRQNGCKMVLDKDLLVKHLKRWTFWNLVKTDMLDRGIPWTELILRDGRMPNDLNLQLSQRVSVALVFLLLCVASAAAYFLGGYFLTPLLALLFFLVLRYWVEPSGSSVSRSAVASFLVTLCTATGLAAWHQMFALIPLLLGGSLPLIFRHRYACATPRERHISSIVAGLYVAASLVLSLSYFPRHLLVSCFLGLLGTLVVLNNHFYLFLAAKQGRLSAFAALPFHLLYHFYNGLSFVVGAARYYTGPALRMKPELARDGSVPPV